MTEKQTRIRTQFSPMSILSSQFLPDTPENIGRQWLNQCWMEQTFLKTKMKAFSDFPLQVETYCKKFEHSLSELLRRHFRTPIV